MSELHSPTPWTLDAARRVIIAANGNFICFRAIPWLEDEAKPGDNMEYIRDCANSHDVLVAALSSEQGDHERLANFVEQVRRENGIYVEALRKIVAVYDNRGSSTGGLSAEEGCEYMADLAKAALAEADKP